MKKVVVLIDGQNLFYYLKSINLYERDIIWVDFLKSLLQPEDELVRTYWFRAERILDSYYTTHNIRSQIIYRQYLSYHRADESTIPVEILAEVDEKVKEVEGWIKAEKTKFSQIQYNYDQICLDNGDIEFVKTGIVKINPFNQEYLGEKGVDIALAVKMIQLSVENKCDKIILVSGDYDYAEAIKFVKNNMTKIHVVKFHKGFPPKNKNMSRDLSVLADKVLDVYESDIKSKCLKK